jgi:hypothetical protein
MAAVKDTKNVHAIAEDCAAYSKAMRHVREPEEMMCTFATELCQHWADGSGWGPPVARQS